MRIVSECLGRRWAASPSRHTVYVLAGTPEQVGRAVTEAMSALARPSPPAHDRGRCPMSALIPAFPTRPADVPEAATVRELLDAYHWHLALAVGGRSARSAPDGLHARHAVAALGDRAGGRRHVRRRAVAAGA